VTLPDLTLQRANGADTIIFIGTPVDPGSPLPQLTSLKLVPQGIILQLQSFSIPGIQDAQIKLSISDLNGMLLKGFPSRLDFICRFPDKISSLCWCRNRSIGTSTQPLSVFILVQWQLRWLFMVCQSWFNYILIVQLNQLWQTNKQSPELSLHQMNNDMRWVLVPIAPVPAINRENWSYPEIDQMKSSRLGNLK